MRYTSFKLDMCHNLTPKIHLCMWITFLKWLLLPQESRIKIRLGCLCILLLLLLLFFVVGAVFVFVFVVVAS